MKKGIYVKRAGSSEEVYFINNREPILKQLEELSFIGRALAETYTLEPKRKQPFDHGVTIADCGNYVKFYEKGSNLFVTGSKKYILIDP